MKSVSIDSRAFEPLMLSNHRFLDQFSFCFTPFVGTIWYDFSQKAQKLIIDRKTTRLILGQSAVYIRL